jgi:hypothetical protein
MIRADPLERVGKLAGDIMSKAIKKFFKEGTIKISREKERSIYFYGMVLFFIFYLLDLLVRR